MPFRHVLLALFVVAVWGLNFVFIKLSVEALPPLLAAGLRFFLAAVPAVFFIRPPRAKFWLVVAYGLSLGVALYSLLNLAIAWGMPAGLSSLVLQTQAFFTMALAFFMLGERPGRFQIIGAAIAFSGIGVIALERMGQTALLPLGMTLLGAASWGLANVLTRKAGKVEALSFTVWGALAAPLPLLVLSFWLEGGDAVMAALRHFGWTELGLIAFQAWPATLVAGGIWSWLLLRHPASVVAPFTLLVPVTGLLSGFLLLGEQVSPVEILGTLLVIAGLVVTVLRRPRLVAPPA